MTINTKNKHNYHFSYYLFYPLFKTIYFLWFNPKIINKEYIPKFGPAIICSNHIHVLDQMGIIFSTKRMVSYLAKKEYFDGRFAWFFKINGVIPVDRSVHDENAKNRAIDILNNNQIIGIFPEGTRNQISSKQQYINELYNYYKDEYSLKKFIKILKNNQVMVSQIEILKKLLNEKKINSDEYKTYIINPKLYLKQLLARNEYADTLLLPLKYGTVSMASKTGAQIVPCVISGRYSFRSRIKYTFLKPIKIDPSDDLETINNKLRNILIEELNKSF